MCGICGILDREGDPRDRRGRVAQMTSALVHRGPDDEGVFDDDAVSLGFRRLAVIDLGTGQQPIRLEDDRAVIVLNGEIYNFRELRRELEPRQRFHSRGDVEVVLRLYAEEGIDCLRRLNGIFALALWDRARRTLYLARDRFGVKPLFVCWDGDSLAFASELGALLAAGLPASREVDRLQLRHFLYQKYCSPEGTLVRGVASLAPATVLEVSPAGRRSYRYWNPAGGTATGPGDAEAVERLGSLLSGAARRQLVADVPVGLFLSGGVDSGTLAALVGQVDGGPLRTFSVGFDSGEVANELPAAASLARRLGTEHHELRLTPQKVAGDLGAILGSLDGPLGDATAVPTWYMSLLARQAVTVALSGEGADELFGGYERQRLDVRIDRVGALGRWAVPLALRLARRRASPRLLERLRMPPGLARQLDWSRVFSARQIDELAVDPLPDEAEMLGLHRELERRWHETARIDAVGARLETDRELFLVGDLLPKVDRMSMAHSLEVRVPYLDNELVDFILGLPGSMKIRGRKDKWLLRRCASRWLPREIVGRKKQGFDVPVSAWLRGALREPLTDYLSGPTLQRRGLFRPTAVAAMVQAHLRREADHGQRLWSLMALEGWMQASLDRRLASRHA